MFYCLRKTWTGRSCDFHDVIIFVNPVSKQFSVHTKTKKLVLSNSLSNSISKFVVVVSESLVFMTD